MMTNLLATIIVTLTTNVTERFPTHEEPAPCPGNTGIAVLAIACWKEVPDANPTNKWVKTTVTRTKTISFDYDPAGGRPTPDKPYSFAYKTEVVSESEVEYVLRQEWEPKVPDGYWITNRFWIGFNFFSNCVWTPDTNTVIPIILTNRP